MLVYKIEFPDLPYGPLLTRELNDAAWAARQVMGGDTDEEVFENSETDYNPIKMLISFVDMTQEELDALEPWEM